VFLFNKKTYLLVEQEARLHVQQEDMCSCSPRRHVFFFNEKTCLPANKQKEETSLIAEQEDLSSCSTRIHAFLLSKKTSLLVEEEGISSC